MSDPLDRSARDLDRECRAFARYLTGQVPTSYVLDKYRDAHARSGWLHPGAAPADRLLLTMAKSSRLGAWLVDCYTAVFAKGAAVRRKSVLVVAILESSAPSAEFFEAPDQGAAGRLVARMCLRGTLFVLGVLGAIVVIGPVHALLAARSKWTA